MRSFYVLSLMLLCKGAFSMEQGGQDPEQAVGPSPMEAGTIDSMTIEEYQRLSSTERVEVEKLVRRAVQLALEKNFDLYMTYDKSAEPLGRSISANMLNNAVIELTHKRAYPEKFGYQPKNAAYYRDYYGEEGAWKMQLQYLNGNLSSLFNKVVDYLTKKDSAFPSTELLIPALSHAAWIGLYSKL